MDHLLISLPLGFDQVISQIQEQDWLINNFEANDEEIYNPANYLYNRDLRGINYRIILDRNIFRFIVSANHSTIPRKKQRAAISLVCFCRTAKIDFEPNLAVYERLLPKRNNITEAIDELITFYKIDSGDDDSLLRYSIAETNHFDIYGKNPCNPTELRYELTKHQWLGEWRSLYVILLKMISVNFTDFRREEKINKFIKWLVKEFKLSLICIIFSVILFSSKRIKKMVKFKLSSTRDEKIDQLYNMTWDLFFMNHYFRKLTKCEADNQFMVASDDKIIKTILRTALNVQNMGSLSHLKNFLPKSDHILVDNVEKILNGTTERIYNSSDWTPEYREQLIDKEEEKVLSLI